MKVRHFDTDEVLEGKPSKELQRENKNAPIQAFRDGSGVWQFIPCGQARSERYRGLEVVVVYLSPT